MILLAFNLRRHLARRTKVLNDCAHKKGKAQPQDENLFAPG